MWPGWGRLEMAVKATGSEAGREGGEGTTKTIMIQEGVMTSPTIGPFLPHTTISHMQVGERGCFDL